MWQALREELHPAGAEVVTVALDSGGAEAAAKWIDRAAPRHPSLIDESHLTAELFGFVNVPSAVWIDETQTLVRPAHAAHVRRSSFEDAEVPEGLGRITEMLREVKKIRRTDPEVYVAAVRDWVQRGADSPYALAPDEVVERSRPRPPGHAEAAACFELGRWLWDAGRRQEAVAWFRQAHRLQPDNWAYKRQAWSLATTAPGEDTDLIQGPTDLYEGNWLDDVRAAGAENYYEPFD